MPAYWLKKLPYCLLWLIYLPLDFWRTYSILFSGDFNRFKLFILLAILLYWSSVLLPPFFAYFSAKARRLTFSVFPFYFGVIWGKCSGLWLVAPYFFCLKWNYLAKSWGEVVSFSFVMDCSTLNNTFPLTCWANSCCFSAKSKLLPHSTTIVGLFIRSLMFKA